MNWVTATVNNCIKGPPGPKIKASSRGEHLICQYVRLMRDIPPFLDGMALPNGPFKKGQIVRADERLARPLEILIANEYARPFRRDSDE